MSVDTKIYVDAWQPATLNDGAGKLTDCATLREAILAWHALPSAQKIRATVKVIGGPVYTAHQIDRIHYGPKPPDQMRAPKPPNEEAAPVQVSDRGQDVLVGRGHSR